MSTRPNKPNDGTKHGPQCRIDSCVCGLPLGAKIGITIIFAWLAWLFMEHRLDRFDNQDGRGRNWRAGLLYGLAGLFLLGLSAARWLVRYACRCDQPSSKRKAEHSITIRH
jgi:hypothetical protein